MLSGFGCVYGVVDYMKSTERSERLFYFILSLFVERSSCCEYVYSSGSFFRHTVTFLYIFIIIINNIDVCCFFHSFRSVGRGYFVVRFYRRNSDVDDDDDEMKERKERIESKKKRI